MLAVRDIMQRKVVSVTGDTSARHLAQILADEDISGVPVLDGNDRLIGVVSSTDLVRLAADETDVFYASAGLNPATANGGDGEEADPADDPADPDPFGFFLPEDSPLVARRLLDQLPESDFDAVAVQDIMTPVSFTVPSKTSVAELCAFLVRGRIHRAVVVDDGRLEGIVTSADVLRAVAEGRLAD